MLYGDPVPLRLVRTRHFAPAARAYVGRRSATRAGQAVSPSAASPTSVEGAVEVVRAQRSGEVAPLGRTRRKQRCRPL